jgi:hypothetical protein
MGKKSFLFTRIVLFVLLFLLFFNIPSGYCFFDKFFTKRQIAKWNESNANNVRIDSSSSSNYRKSGRYDNDYEYFFCFRDWTIKNMTTDVIQNIIIPINFSSNETVVLTKNVCLNINIFPTATVKIDQCFLVMKKYNSPDDELFRLKKQLGEKYGWSTGKAIFIPKLKSLSDYPTNSLGIDIHYNFDYDADKQITK